MKKILNFLMVMLLVMGLGMASVMTAFQAEAAETAETAGETVSAAETVLTANQDGEAAADASMSSRGISLSTSACHPQSQSADECRGFSRPDMPRCSRARQREDNPNRRG